MIVIDCSGSHFQKSLATKMKTCGSRFNIYYGIYDLKLKSADHIARVEEVELGYRYQIAGHGVSPREIVLDGFDDLLQRVLVDNKFFNLTAKLYLEHA